MEVNTVKSALFKGSILLLLILTLTGCTLPGLSGTSKDTIKIGSLTQSESELMAEMLSIMIERETDANTSLVTKLGSSIVQHQGMKRGDIDISSTRYTGTDISGALGMDPIKDPEKALEVVTREFDNRFNQTWAETYGFANSYSIAVTQKFAEENNIETISDLKPYADDLRFGVNNAWVNREGDGYDGFKKTYFDFGDVFPMNLGLVYQAAASGNMDAVLAYSTDGRIKEFKLKVLEDDKQFFPPYDASPVINNETLEKYPEISEITKRLSGQISTEEMQELNYKMDVERKNPKKIAEQFLEKNNYFENTGKGGD
ncbi:osmoprotectant ABC transporter substrate-binding protein [Lentibacillus cibarius]|uniref:Osmoprotectant ABC transporter substrate-binding protein n=1 Tax=Lentibacillus cibarius TaxID=2583219 RepID=A0A549YI38_9BACI|nr:osmoprotectant ABC transporter substrate-binding protein [Lentibacillus cibarius]TRM11538.1 osmoprotectant ABC transporter substrate-binding protein [Lentibacillus cibarius]